MKPATHFYRSFPPHLLPVVPVPENIPQNAIATAAKQRAFIWPEITREDHKKTMDNYRAYIQAVNDAIPELNRKIKKHNKAVAAFTKKNPVTASKEVLIKLFTSNFNSLQDTEYNKAVASFNENHGMYFNLRTFKMIKYNSLQIFESMLHAYTVQLSKFTAIWKQTGKHSATPLPKCEIHPFEIINQERGEGVLNMDVSTRTIYRHRDRLEEVGVLVQKEYRGTKRPVNYFFADAILSVSEAYTPKMQNADNQFFKGSKLTECQHIKVSTRSNRNKEEIKGIVNNSDERNAPSSLFSNLIFYKTTNLQDGKNFTSGAEKSKPGAKNFDGFGGKNTEATPEPRMPAAQYENETWAPLVENLETRYDLAAKLANGEFNFYRPLEMKLLNELVNSTITDDDFRDLLIQDFAKSAAAINRHNQAGAGSWHVALGAIDTDFACINFQGRAMKKPESLKKLIEFRYRLHWALNWFTKKEWVNTPYASRYFDPSRTLPSDISWQYTKKIWSKKMQKKTKVAAEKKRKAAEAAKRKAALSTDRKARQMLDNAIYRYLRKELNLVQLTAYTVRELPQLQQSQMLARLQELTMRKLTKQ